MTENEIINVGPNRRQLKSNEEKLLKKIEGTIPSAKIEALRRRWESEDGSKVPKEQSWIVRNWLGIFFSVGIIFLGINLYFKGQVATTIDYAAYSVTLNHLVMVGVILISALFAVLMIVYAAKIVSEQPLLDYSDVDLIPKKKNLPVWILEIVFAILFIFNGFWNVLIATGATLVIIITRALARKVRDKALTDINAL